MYVVRFIIIVRLFCICFILFWSYQCRSFGDLSKLEDERYHNERNVDDTIKMVRQILRYCQLYLSLENRKILIFFLASSQFLLDYTNCKFFSDFVLLLVFGIFRLLPTNRFLIIHQNFLPSFLRFLLICIF